MLRGRRPALAGRVALVLHHKIGRAGRAQAHTQQGVIVLVFFFNKASAAPMRSWAKRLSRWTGQHLLLRGGLTAGRLPSPTLPVASLNTSFVSFGPAFRQHRQVFGCFFFLFGAAFLSASASLAAGVSPVLSAASPSAGRAAAT